MILHLGRRIKQSIFPNRTPIFAAAQTQILSAYEVQKAPYPLAGALANYDDTKSEESSTSEESSSHREPNALDKITTFGGSSFIFLSMLLLVVIWIFYGFFYGFSNTWQIIFQNASSIQVYVTDMLLIRQQLNTSRKTLTTLAEFNSRSQTYKFLFAHIPECDETVTHKTEPRSLYINGKPFSDSIDEREFVPVKSPSRLSYIWNRTCDIFALMLGSIWAFAFYWLGIIVWIVLGPSLRFSDTWQLYINTATALVLTFTTVFLQNIQQREEEKLSPRMNYAQEIDAIIEYRLRILTAYQKNNVIHSISSPDRSFTERISDLIADIMGSGLGVLLSMLFFAAWVGLGPYLAFDMSWWLIIGSFTGLVGFINGFVLRSLYFREDIFLKDQFEQLAASDRAILAKLNVPNKTPAKQERSLAQRITLSISNICGHRYTPIVAIGFVILLLILATILLWSVTGQLLCNTSTMIIGGFLLFVLIHAHNNSNKERDADFCGLLKRKLLLYGYVHTLS